MLNPDDEPHINDNVNLQTTTAITIRMSSNFLVYAGDIGADLVWFWCCHLSVKQVYVPASRALSPCALWWGCPGSHHNVRGVVSSEMSVKLTLIVI